MVNSRFWTVLPFSSVCNLSHLALVLAGIIPQLERCPRPIMDYTYNTVNQSATPLAPHLAMQFGTALQRILQKVAYANPSYGPVFLAKLDLADGYYRIPLAPHAAQQLAVVLPLDQTRENLVGIPLSLPMGWAPSPPYFCAFTETSTDIVNNWLSQPDPPLQPHRLEDATQTQPLPQHDIILAPLWQPSLPTKPLASVDVYIDDFLLAAQRPELTKTMQSTLHAIDSVFYDDPQSTRRPVISTSKLQKGDASWDTKKRILGWDLDTVTQTIHLPAHRLARITDILALLLDQSRVSKQKWHTILGELRSMVPAMFCSKYLFCVLQHALQDQTGPCIRLNRLLKSAIRDWIALASEIHTVPAPIAALIPTAPQVVGASDACAQGMGGGVGYLLTFIHTHFSPLRGVPPFPRQSPIA